MSLLRVPASLFGCQQNRKLFTQRRKLLQKSQNVHNFLTAVDFELSPFHYKMTISSILIALVIFDRQLSAR